MATIRRERVSVLVAVPRMIESLKQKIERDLGGRWRPRKICHALCQGREPALSAALVDVPPTCAASLDGSSGP